LGVGTQLSQRLDYTVAEPAATMNGNAGRLVEHDQGLVFINNRSFEAFEQTLRKGHGLIALGQPQRRNTHNVARLQLVLGLDPTLVHPYLTLAQDAVDERL